MLGRVLHSARGLQAPTKRGPLEGGCETRHQSSFMGPSASPKSKLRIFQPWCNPTAGHTGFFIFFSLQCPGLMWGATSFNSYPFTAPGAPQRLWFGGGKVSPTTFPVGPELWQSLGRITRAPFTPG